MKDSGPLHVPVASLLGETSIVQKAVFSHRAILVALENRNSLSLPRIQPRFLDLPARTAVITMNELHLLTQLLLVFILMMSIFKFDRYSVKKE